MKPRKYRRMTSGMVEVTGSRAERQLQELSRFKQRDSLATQLSRYSAETVSLFDARGRHVDNRGPR